MPQSDPRLFRIRVVKTFNAGNAEVTNDLPHLHQCHIDIAAMQPGNPGSNVLGAFTIKLHPPGSEGYAAAKATYDLLDYIQRVELYVSHDSASLGKLYYAGIITGIRKSYGQTSVFELTGHSDLVLLNLSRPFPGELLSNDVVSAMIKSYMGTNELGASDTFSPYTASNYTSTNIPGSTSGTWTSATDDGFPVVTCSTGTGAVLINKTGAATNDRWHTHFVEATGRLLPAPLERLQAGVIGVGLSWSNANCNDAILGYVYASVQGSQWILNAQINRYVGGVATAYPVGTSALGNVGDPQGYIPLTIGLLITNGGAVANAGVAVLTVNGKLVASAPTAWDAGTVTRYPFLFSAISSTGTANSYLTNLVQMTRFTTDGPSTAATFANGTITASTNSLAFGNDPGPTFLEAQTRLATREGWYLRYNPQAYVVGTRTLGTVDMAADPGTDRSKSVIFSSADGTLVSLELTANADAFAADTAATGQSTLDGGGIGFWRDIASLIKYGVIQDEVLAFTHSDFNSLRRAVYKISSNKVSLSSVGSKIAIVLCDPQTAFSLRELDRVTIDCPELGVYKLVSRIITIAYDEGQGTMTLTLDQFTVDS